MSGGRRATREEQRRRRPALLRWVVVAGLTAALPALLAGLGGAPTEGREAETAASFAAAREYDRALERYGDEITAREMAGEAYAYTMVRWAP